MSEKSVSAPHVNALVVRMGREISRHNPAVQAISARMGWKTETLITRIQTSLPSVIEQHLYLRLARSMPLQPESLQKILRHYLGPNGLQASDLLSRPQGANLSTNRFDETAEYLENVLHLLRKANIDLAYSLSIFQAADLSLLYGDHAEGILDSIDSNLEDIRAKFHFRRFQRAVVFMIAVKVVINYARERGGVCLADVMDIFDEMQFTEDQVMKLLTEDGND
jgi:hypothetical protein